MDHEELLRRLRQGNYANVRFADFVSLAERFGFELERVAGSHHIFHHAVARVRLNIQPVKRDATPYQLRQFLQLIERYGLQWDDFDG